MKKFLKIAGIILLCIVFVLGGLAIWQKDNIKAFINSARYSEEELVNMAQNADEKLKKEVEESLGVTLREITQEEQQQIDNGEISKDEVISKIITEATEEKRQQEEKKQQGQQGAGGQSETASQPQQKSAQTMINECVSQLYSLKGSYMGRLDSLIGSAAAEYQSLVAEGKASTAKATLMSKYMSAAAGLESACDGEVERLLSNLTAELKARNHSLDIVKTIRSAYANEKSAKMAQLIGKYR